MRLLGAELPRSIASKGRLVVTRVDAPLVALAEHLEQQLGAWSSTAARSRVRRRIRSL